MALWTGSACRINISRIESDPLTPYLSRYFLLIVHCYSELDEFKTATETGKYTGRPSAIVILSDWVCFTFTKFLHQGFYCYLQSSFLVSNLYFITIRWFSPRLTECACDHGRNLDHLQGHCFELISAILPECSAHDACRSKTTYHRPTKSQFTLSNIPSIFVLSSQKCMLITLPLPLRFKSSENVVVCFREQHCNLSGMPKLLVFMAQNVTRIFIRADFADGRRKITYL